MLNSLRANPLIAVGAALFAVIIVAAIFLSGGVGASSSFGSADTPMLKRVMLSSGGVGYFEYEARVDGDSTLSLPPGTSAVPFALRSSSHCTHDM